MPARLLDVDLDFLMPRPKPAAFLPRFLIIFGLVSSPDRVTKNGDDLELPISRNKGAEVTYLFYYSL